jgi:hypothetical protein
MNNEIINKITNNVYGNANEAKLTEAECKEMVELIQNECGDYETDKYMIMIKYLKIAISLLVNDCDFWEEDYGNERKLFEMAKALNQLTE